MKINKKLIKYNYSSRKGVKIKSIVIHDTGNQSATADAENHYKYFSGGNRQASAHYFVDDKQILQIIEDSNAAWHAGDGKGKYGITNANTLGIEICVNKGADYLKAVQSTIELTAYLMQLHDIPIEEVIRHYDASRKNCPASMSKNNWEAWRAFKVALEREVKKVPNGIKVNIKGKDHYMEGIFQNDKNYVGVRELAETLGHVVTWDQNTKTVIIK